jgi:hypothetical protein
MIDKSCNLGRKVPNHSGISYQIHERQKNQEARRCWKLPEQPLLIKHCLLQSEMDVAEQDLNYGCKKTLGFLKQPAFTAFQMRPDNQRTTVWRHEVWRRVLNALKYASMLQYAIKFC